MVLMALVLGSALRAENQDVAVEELPPEQTKIEAPRQEDLPEPHYPAYFNNLDKAKLLSFTGRYKRALEMLEKIGDADPVQAALIRGESLVALGREDEAMDALSQPGVKDDPSVQVMRATLLAETGKIDEALALLREHLEAHPQSIAGRYHLGAISEIIGDHETARQAYAWFVEPPQNFMVRMRNEPDEAVFQSAESMTLIGRGVDRWATLNGEYQRNENLHNALLRLFVRVYDQIERGYWPAHVAAAEFFLARDDSHKAVEELEAALERNPASSRVYELLGQIALENFNFDGGDAATAAIRTTNPNSLRAELLEARNLLLQRRPADATPPVQRVLQRQPKHIEAMGLLAAIHALQLQDEQMRAVLAQVEQIDPNNATAYFEVAEQLAAMRQYPRSAEMYQIAIERAPWWTAARNGLGLLYTQSGDEDLAHATLDAAHALDPFNLRTTNYLRLLDRMLSYDRLETENFVLIYDGKADPLIPTYFADFLEQIHAEVSEAFAHEPDVKTLIEVFPTHDAFSVRTTGSPWIGTVGASTGRVIALVSPRGGAATMGTYNWAQVLRHEYTHTVTLSATENRIPHWMTEGLAVLEERVPLRWDWVPMLYHAVTEDELFTLENLTWGFVRPKRPIDRQLAYAQSYWICKFIEETWGRDALLKMLAEFREARTEAEVFEKVLGKSTDQFTEAFLAWTQREISTWGYDPDTSAKYSELRQHGEDLIKTKQLAAAVEVWEQIAAMRPVDALPHQRLAGLYLHKEVNQPEKAIEHLDRLHQVELKDNRYAKRIARIYRDIGKIDDAVRYGMEAVYVDPYDLDAHELLAELYEKAGDAEGLKREQRAIAVLKQRAEEARKQRSLN
jgi:tetratricopeptide (TPR) repeat protein